MSVEKPSANRKPKYVPPVDAEGNYAADAIFANPRREQTPKEPHTRTFGAAYRLPPGPPPEEQRPIRRHSPLAEDHPPRTGHPDPGLSARDAST